MIVRRARFEDGCTVWRTEGEAGDRDLPRNSLWISGLVRAIPVPLEALCLALTLGRFAARLVVPGVIDASLAEALSALAGVQVASGAGEDVTDTYSGTHEAVLVRDSFDDYLSARAGLASTFSVTTSHEVDALQANHGSFRVVTNAGTLRRCLDPLDRVGDLAASMMVAPVLRIRDIAAYSCREELAGLDVQLLIDVARRAGVRLDLPMAPVSVKALGRLANDSPSTSIAFNALYRRYRMSPAVIAEIYEEMKAGLATGNGDDAPARIAEYLAREASQTART